MTPAQKVMEGNHCLRWWDIFLGDWITTPSFESITWGARTVQSLQLRAGRGPWKPKANSSSHACVYIFTNIYKFWKQNLTKTPPLQWQKTKINEQKNDIVSSWNNSYWVNQGKKQQFPLHRAMKDPVKAGFTWLLRKSVTHLLFTSGARRGSGRSCGWIMPFPAGTWLIHSLSRIHTWAPGQAAAGTGTHHHPCGQKGNMKGNLIFSATSVLATAIKTRLSLLFTAPQQPWAEIERALPLPWGQHLRQLLQGVDSKGTNITVRKAEIQQLQGIQDRQLWPGLKQGNHL